jgi:hypothetical protein
MGSAGIASSPPSPYERRIAEILALIPLSVIDVSNVTLARRAISIHVVASTPCMGAELPP